MSFRTLVIGSTFAVCTTSSARVAAMMATPGGTSCVGVLFPEYKQEHHQHQHQERKQCIAGPLKGLAP